MTGLWSSSAMRCIQKEQCMRRSVLSVAVVMITALVVGLFAASTPSRAQANARVNILHLAPFAPTIDGTAVTVVVNGATLASDFKYKDAPLTATLPPGDYTVQVFAGTNLTVAPAITATVSLASGSDYTVFAGGDGNNIPLGLFPLVDDNSVPEAPNANVRVVHAAPFAAQAETAVDVRNATTDEVIGGLSGVEFGVASGYLPIPGDTDIPVKVVPTSDPMADPPIIGPANLNVPAQSITTVFAIGTGTATYPAEFFFLGGTQRVPAQVRLAHLAPFAGGRAAVNVVVPGDTPLTLVSDFGFGDTTDYVPLTDGTYPINVVIPSAPRALADTVAISGSVTLSPGMRYTAMAIGGANGFAPELVLLNDPITPPITDTARVRIYHAAPFAPG
ncbi:MAG: DUF4397 domain-containing protein, partial [Chloroflexia bacterium]|nr:DUF4397 domain-containing protein [Chloroflexia bacterium]